MASSMWQQQLTLILLLGVICARCTAAPLADDGDEDEDELLLVMTTTEKQHRIDCKLALDATMDSLEQQQLLEAMGCSRTNKPATTTTTTTTDVEQDEEQTVSPSVLRHSRPGGSSQPLYELQLVVWPAGVDGNGDDGIVPVVVTTPRTTRATTTTPTTISTTTTASPMTTTTTTTTSPSVGVPLYEDQLVVFPQMDFQEENFDYFFDESSSTTTKRPTSSSSGNAATSSKPVYVLENFRKQHPNGTEEHKLVLSNGLVNYMKHYPKQVDDKVINVQEGYSSLPVAGVQPQIQTLYYIADEHGYNIHKIERSPLPLLLSQRALPKATEAPTATTSTM